ncbi:MAG: bifunctional ornithine acetyltransferase/N-acetylglutamate synthase, partial [Oscillospiraceae bacterium]|nr:bifunctional ornithine acetyltransferase/N-acetylglutamate synthase [Oscillospiraceae bacterium]
MVTFDGFIPAVGGVCAAKGFTAGGINIGVKKGSEKKDLALIYCVSECEVVALYTTNKVQGAPIAVTKKHLESTNGKARAVIINSGNANTCNPDGVEIAEKMCELTAKSLSLKKEEVYDSSTGVIVQPIRVAP